jgi:hypothetical protein
VDIAERLHYQTTTRTPYHPDCWSDLRIQQRQIEQLILALALAWVPALLLVVWVGIAIAIPRESFSLATRLIAARISFGFGIFDSSPISILPVFPCRLFQERSTAF